SMEVRPRTSRPANGTSSWRPGAAPSACSCRRPALFSNRAGRMSEVRDLTHFVHRADDGTARLHLAVDGIACAACMARIESGLAAVPAVTRARVNLTNRRVAVEWTGALDPARVVDRLAELGFKAYPFDPARVEAQEGEAAAALLRRLGVAA